MSTSPPIAWRNGIRSTWVITAIRASRSMTAPTVPPIKPKSLCRGGKVRTAMAITRALSPASERSMITMPSQRAQISGWIFKDAEDWFFEDDHEWPFSFINICETFGFDPHYLRRGLLRWKEKAIRERSRLAAEFVQR